MHIAFFSPGWPPETIQNGIVTCVRWMRQGLQQDGHRVSIFAGGPDSLEAEPDLYSVQRALAGRLARRIARSRFPIERDILEFGHVIAEHMLKVHRRDPIDVIEMEESMGWAADVAAGTSIPVVTKLHGPGFLHIMEEERETPFAQAKIQREGEALARLPVIVAPSQSTLNETLARYALQPKLARQLVNPITLGEGTPLWNLDRCDRSTVLFVGRFDKIKGGDLALLGFQKLLARQPQMRLVVVGTDPGLLLPGGTRVHIKDYIASLRDDALERAVTYRGRLAPAEIAELRASSLVTMVTSRHENQAYTVLEAMLQGCPVVCADNSGSSESIEHQRTGLLVETENTAEIAAQLERIVVDPELGRSLGQAARDYILRTHSPAVVVAHAIDIYREAMALSAAGRKMRG